MISDLGPRGYSACFPNLSVNKRRPFPLLSLGLSFLALDAIMSRVEMALDWGETSRLIGFVAEVVGVAVGVVSGVIISNHPTLRHANFNFNHFRNGTVGPGSGGTIQLRAE